MSAPKAVVDAFLPDVLRVGQHTLRPATLGHYLLLEKLDSPFTRTPEEAKERPKIIGQLDIARACYVLSMTDAQIQECYEEFDRQAFEKAAWKFSLTVPMQDMGAMGELLLKSFARATATLIGAGGDGGAESEEPDGKKKSKPSKTSTARESQTDSGGR